MGWVEQEFLNRIGLRDHAPELWNKMRDAIGEAVTEYNRRVEGTEYVLSQTDCTSNGELCRRIEKKLDRSWIEVFLDTGDASLKVQRPPNNISRICQIRTAADGSTPEFWHMDAPASAAKACEMALREFLFNPAPPLLGH